MPSFGEYEVAALRCDCLIHNVQLQVRNQFLVDLLAVRQLEKESDTIILKGTYIRRGNDIPIERQKNKTTLKL